MTGALWVSALCWASAAFAQSDAGLVAETRLKGRIVERGTHDLPLDALVSVPDAGLLVEAGLDGAFELGLPAGSWDVVIQSPGHEPLMVTETTRAGEEREVTYRLRRLLGAKYETVVRSPPFRTQVPAVTLSGRELTGVAGTQGEPLRVVTTLPGVTTLGSGLSYPVVRGASPSATGFFVDGVRIPQLFHLLAGPSVIHPDFLDAIDYFADAPLAFGRLTGGVVSASVTKPRDRWRASVSVDLLNAGAFVEAPLPTGTTVTLAGRTSTTGWLTSLIAPAINPAVTPIAQVYDYQGRVEQKVARASLRLLALGSSDLIGTQPTDTSQATTLLSSAFHRLDVRLLAPVGGGVLELGGGVGWERLGTWRELRSARTDALELLKQTGAGRATYRLEADAWAFRAGLDAELQHATVEGFTSNAAHSGPASDGVMGGGFAELGLFAGDWQLSGGLRADLYRSASTTLLGVDPRVSLRWQASPDSSAHVLLGVAHQAPSLLLPLPVSDFGALERGLQEEVHTSVGGEWTSPWSVKVQADAFLNLIPKARERSILEYLANVETVDSRYQGSRTGRAVGLELMLRLPERGRVFGWLSYTLMRSERSRAFGVLGQPSLVQVEQLPFAFDQTHTLNAVAGYQWANGWRLSGTFHVNTGRPESGEFSSRTMRLVPTDLGERWAPVALNQVDRLPTFFRLDVGAAKTWVFDRHTLELHLDFFNLTLSQEVYGYNYTYAPDGTPWRQPVAVPVFFPSIGLKGTL